MNKTCKDCRVQLCYANKKTLGADLRICPFFEFPDGKIPRFCRLASSVDAMAEAMVFCDGTAGGARWSFSSSGDVYETYEDAKEAAKAWLMEVDE